MANFNWYHSLDLHHLMPEESMKLRIEKIARMKNQSLSVLLMEIWQLLKPKTKWNFKKKLLQNLVQKLCLKNLQREKKPAKMIRPFRKGARDVHAALNIYRGFVRSKNARGILRSALKWLHERPPLTSLQRLKVSSHNLLPI